MTISGSTFDPQQATYSYSVYNKNPRFHGVFVVIEVGYRSQNGYVWDGTSCTAQQIIAANLNASVAAPGENVMLSCEATGNPSVVTPHHNTSGIVFNAITPADGWYNFTFLAPSAPKTVLLNCTVGDDPMSLTVDSVELQVSTAPVVPVPVWVPGRCVNELPTAGNVTWPAVPGATKYDLYVIAGDSPPASWTPKENKFNTTDTNCTIAAPKLGEKFVYGVVAVGAGGRKSGAGNVSVTITCAPLDPLAIPDAFSRAYFAKHGGKRVAAYWVDKRATIVYEGFTSDMSTLADERANRVYGLSAGVQYVTFDTTAPDALSLWHRFTSGLRISQ
jgi:hypothetical protein